MPDTRVRLVVTYEAFVDNDGKHCSRRCKWIDTRADGFCQLFKKDLSGDPFVKRCPECLAASQRAAEVVEGSGDG